MANRPKLLPNTTGPRRFFLNPESYLIFPKSMSSALCPGRGVIENKHREVFLSKLSATFSYGARTEKLLRKVAQKFKSPSVSDRALNPAVQIDHPEK
jgi:hypothetical protein